MLRLISVRQPPKTVAVSRAVDDAAVGLVFDDLRLPLAKRRVAVAIDLVLPAHQKRFRKPLAQAGDDLRRWLEFEQHVAIAGAVFALVQRLELAVVVPPKNLANGKVAHGGGVKTAPAPDSA